MDAEAAAANCSATAGETCSATAGVASKAKALMSWICIESGPNSSRHLPFSTTFNRPDKDMLFKPIHLRQRVE